MLEIIDIGAENVLACRIDGKIELDDIERVKTRVEEILADHEKVRVYAEVESFDGISFSALWEDLKMGFGNLKKFSHKAVVSDKRWMANMAKVADKIFPFIELKQFPTEERDAAIEWIKS
ncbi:MAG: SpoIIAA family protein [Planctomycetota bacterium]|jgi:hypothetical protein